jgi:hypothetical protein
MHLIESSRQPGDLRVLREVFRGFSEEARTRGFASLPFDRFAFVTTSLGEIWAFFNAKNYVELIVRSTVSTSTVGRLDRNRIDDQVEEETRHVLNLRVPDGLTAKPLRNSPAGDISLVYRVQEPFAGDIPRDPIHKTLNSLVSIPSTVRLFFEPNAQLWGFRISTTVEPAHAEKLAGFLALDHLMNIRSFLVGLQCPTDE